MAAAIELEYQGRLAVITFNNDKKLNAMNQQQYYELAQKMREVATHDEVFITLLIGKGRFFSAGADVSASRPLPGSPGSGETDTNLSILQGFVAFNLNLTEAFYSHPKILIAALNGPVVGLSAALVAHADFIYAVPDAFLLTPFSSLGLVAEGAASRMLVQRLGIATANEALIMSRKIPADDLLAAGFVNKIIDAGKSRDADEKFKQAVLKEIDDRLGEHLNGDSMLEIKKLIRGPEREALDSVNVREVFEGMRRFASGVPQEEFMKIASGKKRHKL